MLSPRVKNSVINDAVLKDYLAARGPEEISRSLEEVIFSAADPLVRRIVGFRLGSSASPQDREDIVGDVTLELISRLEALRTADPGAGSIANFPAYASVAAHHGCDRYLRRRFPQRHRLKNRLRHLLENSREYALWQTPEGDFIAGPAGCRGAAPVKDLPPDWTTGLPRPVSPSPGDAVAAIFAARAPLRLSDLVDAAALLLGVHDEPAAELDESSAALSTSTPDPADRIDQCRRLARLWTEISALPHPQPVVLLLNLRDEQGFSPLAAFPAAGVASMRRIAEVLQIPAAELAELWGKLPLSDLEIAGRLGLTRQQVINMRQAARQRLIRRGGGNIAPASSSTKGRGHGA